jgi:hypothetical protein
MGADRSDAAAEMRRRNLRTGWVLAGIALALALSIWYSKLG